jgi:hypothetical protein
MVPDAVETAGEVVAVAGGVLGNARRGGEVERERAAVRVMVPVKVALVGVAVEFLGDEAEGGGIIDVFRVVDAGTGDGAGAAEGVVGVNEIGGAVVVGDGGEAATSIAVGGADAGGGAGEETRPIACPESSGGGVGVQRAFVVVVEFFREQAGLGVVVPSGEGAAGIDGDALGLIG